MRKFLVTRTREDGFTLIELLVVVIIIAILAAIAVPVYIGIQNNAKKSGLQSDVATTKLNLAAALTEDGTIGTGGTFTSQGKAGDATVQNSGISGDEIVTVVVNADNSFTVSAKSAKLNYTAAADSATGQQTSTTGPTAQDLVTIPSVFKLDSGAPSRMSFLLYGADLSSSQSAGTSGLATISPLSIYNGRTPNGAAGTTYYTLNGLYDANGNSLTTLMRNADGSVGSYFSYSGDPSNYNMIVRLTITGNSYNQAAADSVAKIVFSDGNGNSFTVTK